jgi:hypothetical protein
MARAAKYSIYLAFIAFLFAICLWVISILQNFNTNASKMLPDITCRGPQDLLDAAIDQRAPVDYRTGAFYCFCKANFFKGVDLDSLAFPDGKAYCATEWL